MDRRQRLALLSEHPLPRFVALAAVGFAFDLTMLALLNRYTPLPDAATVTLAFWATYALNFVLNRRFAFQADEQAVGPQLARFMPQVLGDYLLTLTGVLALQAIGLPLITARIAAGATNLAFNYTLYRWWTFRRGGTDARTSPRPEEHEDRQVTDGLGIGAGHGTKRRARTALTMDTSRNPWTCQIHGLRVTPPRCLPRLCANGVRGTRCMTLLDLRPAPDQARQTSESQKAPQSVQTLVATAIVIVLVWRWRRFDSGRAGGCLMRLGGRGRDRCQRERRGKAHYGCHFTHGSFHPRVD
ncbi:hypothetical protein GCM10027575_29490 [Phytohabitans suffuscus]